MALQTKTFEGVAGSDYWRYTVEVTENSIDSSDNTSSVTAKVYLGRTGSGSSMTGASISGSVTISGTTKSFSYSNSGTVSVGVGQKILKIGEVNFTIEHDSDGSKTISISSSMTNNVRPVSGTLTAKSMALTDIARTPTVTQSNTAKTETTITMKWTSDLTIDRVRYSTNGGTSWTTYTSSANAKSGSYKISGLSPGTTYSIKTEVRSKESQLTKVSSALSVKTVSAPTITQSVASKTETSITVKWTSDSTIDRVRYSLNGGSSWTTVTSAANAKTGTFTIGSLSAAESYTIRTEVRRDGTSVTNYSNMTVSTYNWPYANSMPDFVIGNTLRIGIYNPLGRTVKVYLRAAGETVGSVNTITGTSVSGYTGSAYTTDLYNSIPDALSGTYSVRCVTTLNGVDHTINKTGGTYSVNTNANKPSIGGVSYSDENDDTFDVTEDRTAIISGQSTVRVSASGLTAKNGASIESCSFVYTGSTINRAMTVSGSTATADNVYKFSGDSVKVTVTVTDSRGLTDIRSVTIPLISYVNPTAKISLYRENSYYDTTYLTVTAGCSPVNVGGTDKNSIIKVTYATRLAGTSDPFLPNPPTEIASGTQYTITLANTSAWDFQIIVHDELTSVSFTAQLPKGIPLVMFDRKRNSVGINAIPSHDDALEVGGNAYVDGQLLGVRVYSKALNDSNSPSFFLIDSDDDQLGRIYLTRDGSSSPRRIVLQTYKSDPTYTESYRLPAPDTAGSSSDIYDILTTKTVQRSRVALSANVAIPTGTTPTNLLELDMEAGVYLITAQVQFAASSGGTFRGLYLGTETSGTAAYNAARVMCPPVASGSYVTTLNASSILSNAAARTIYLNAIQNTGSNLNVTSTYTWLSVLRLS